MGEKNAYITQALNGDPMPFFMRKFFRFKILHCIGIAVVLVILLGFVLVWFLVPGDTSLSQCEPKEYSAAQTIESLRSTWRSCQYQTSAIHELSRSRHDQSIFEHRVRALYWQHLWATLSFALVMLVVVVGLYLAYLEFKPADSRVHQLKIGSSGLELSSPILGLVILALSLGFFSIYLIHGLPIKELQASVVRPAAPIVTGGPTLLALSVGATNTSTTTSLTIHATTSHAIFSYSKPGTSTSTFVLYWTGLKDLKQSPTLVITSLDLPR